MEDDLEGVDLEVHKLSKEFDLPKENFVVKDGVIERIIQEDGNIIFPDYETEVAEEAEKEFNAPLPGITGGLIDKGIGDLLGKAGYELENFAFKGKKVDVLTKDEQEELLLHELVKGRNAFKSQEEVDVINFLRTGKSVKDFAEYVINNDPKLAASRMSDAELVQKNLKEVFPELSEDELKEEFESLDEGKIAKRAVALRKRMEEKPLDITKVTREEQDKLKGEHTVQVKEFVNSVMGIESIAGFTLTDDMRNAILNDVATENYEEDSPFINELTNPEKVIELSFYKLYTPAIIDHFQRELENVRKTEYEKGYNTALGKLPKDKVVKVDVGTGKIPKAVEAVEEF